MQDPWFSHGFERVSINRVLCVMWHRSTQGQTRRALRRCWFPIGFYKVFLTDRPAPDWGVQQQGHFRSDATLCDLLVFPLVLVNSGKPCSDPVVFFFLPSRKCLFSNILKVFWGCSFFDRGIVQ